MERVGITLEDLEWVCKWRGRVVPLGELAEARETSPGRLWLGWASATAFLGGALEAEASRRLLGREKLVAKAKLAKGDDDECDSDDEPADSGREVMIISRILAWPGCSGRLRPKTSAVCSENWVQMRKFLRFQGLTKLGAGWAICALLRCVWWRGGEPAGYLGDTLVTGTARLWPVVLAGGPLAVVGGWIFGSRALSRLPSPDGGNARRMAASAQPVIWRAAQMLRR